MADETQVEHPTAGPPEIHLRDYWRVIWRGRYTILTILALTVGLAILKTSLTTPQYRATAVIEIKPEARQILPGQEQWVGAEGRSWIAEELYFNTQLHVLKSRDLAERVVRQLRLEQHPLFKEHQDPVGAFQARVEVRPRANTRLVEVSMTGPDPKEVVEWVNTLAHAYVRRNVEEAAQSFNAVLDEINRGLASFREGLGQAGLEAFQTAAERELYVPEAQRGAITKVLETYYQELAEVRLQTADLEAEVKAIEEMHAAGRDPLTLSRFSEDALLRRLYEQRAALQTELETIANEKTPGHPEYLEKQQALLAVQQEIGRRLGQLEDGVREALRIAREKEKELLAQIRETEKRGHEIEKAATGYDILKTDAESKRRVYDAIRETIERFSIGAKLIYMNNNVAVVDEAIEPLSPVRPRKLLTLAFAAFVGLMFGVGAVLFLDYLDSTIRTPEEVEQYLGLPVLAMVPRFTGKGGRGEREAFQTLRTSLLFARNRERGNIVMLTSAGPQEGKSETVKHLALAFASAGSRVVIVEGDLRRPTQHRLFGVSREPGLTSHLAEPKSVAPEQILRHNARPQVDVIPSGPVPPDPAEILGREAFRNLLARLRKEYEWVILDSPPVANLADSLILAQMADSVVFVIRYNENDRDLIRRSLRRLARLGIRPAGAVLNAVEVEGGYYGKYGYYYYSRPEEEEDTSREARRRKRRRHVAL